MLGTPIFVKTAMFMAASVTSNITNVDFDYTHSVAIIVTEEVIQPSRKVFHQTGRLTVVKLGDGTIAGLTVGHMFVPEHRRGTITKANLYFSDFSLKLDLSSWMIAYDRHSDIGLVRFGPTIQKQLQNVAIPYADNTPPDATFKLLAKKRKAGDTYITSPCKLNTDGKRHALATENSTVPITSAAITARCNRKYIGAGYSGSGLVAESPDGQSVLVGVFFGDAKYRKAPYNAAFTTIPDWLTQEFNKPIYALAGL